MDRTQDQELRKLKKRLMLEGGRGGGGTPSELRLKVLAKIDELREESWKQREIADALGLHKTTVGRWLKERDDQGARSSAPIMARQLKEPADSVRKKRQANARSSMATPVRLVEMTTERGEVDRIGGRTLVLRGCARIEGLSFDDVVELARRLS
jgi:predicted transcriptional regulator